MRPTKSEYVFGAFMDAFRSFNTLSDFKADSYVAAATESEEKVVHKESPFVIDDYFL